VPDAAAAMTRAIDRLDQGMGATFRRLLRRIGSPLGF
jgi:hypothetical protein